jgi:ribonucleotide monophosphatase NagD (HAD superfamily)
VVIGDKQSDIELAKNAGLAGGILVATGKGCDQAQRLGLAPLGQEQYRVLVDIKGYDRLVYAQDLGAAASWLTQMPDLGSRSLRS